MAANTNKTVCPTQVSNKPFFPLFHSFSLLAFHFSIIPLLNYTRISSFWQESKWNLSTCWEKVESARGDNRHRQGFKSGGHGWRVREGVQKKIKGELRAKRKVGSLVSELEVLQVLGFTPLSVQYVWWSFERVCIQRRDWMQARGRSRCGAVIKAFDAMNVILKKNKSNRILRFTLWGKELQGRNNKRKINKR